MDFKSLISKLDSMDAPPTTPKAPELPKSVQLDEDAQLRVLSGTSSILAESELMEKKLTAAEKEKKEEVVKSMKKDKEGFKERYGKRGEEVMHATATKIAKKKAESVESEEKLVKEHKTEGIDVESFRSKFLSLVEAKKEEEKKKTVKGKKAEEKMDESAKPDFLDIDNDGNKKEKMSDAAKDAEKEEKKDGKKEKTKGLSAKQKKLPPGLQKAIAKKKGTKESVESSKQLVAESIEQPKLTFREMMSLVVESGGQQRIDPLDKELFTWATRVAQNKLGEGMKAEVYAGLVYERMGGRFEMYDVLSEDKE